MLKTVKVKLDDYQDWATRIQCCGKDKWFRSEDMNANDMWVCKDCDKLLIAVCPNGVPYFVGNQIFDRKRK